MGVPDQTRFGVGTWVERRARIAPDQVALIAGAGPVTYAQLAARIRRLANGLRALGVRPGDRIAWRGPNHAAFLETLFAAGQLGCILAPVNHRLDPETQALVLADTEPTILVEHQPIGQVRLPPTVLHRVTVGGPLDGTLDHEALVGGSRDVSLDVPVGLDDVILLPHTSGTVGRPKAVMLTHANVIWNVVNLLGCADFRIGDVTIAIAPFFRVGGTGVNILPVLFMGGTVVIPADADADGILTLMERHGVTVGFGNPDLLDALASTGRWLDVDLSSLRFVITGGAPVPERLIRTYLDRGVPLLQGYGLSEAAPVALLLDPASALRKVGSAGKPPLLVDVRIVGEDGLDVAAGETGELLIRGPNVMAGYWRRPEATREVLGDDGWLRTGDAAMMDREGYVWIVDRMTAAFISGGTTVYPGDVERVLLEHPAVADAGVAGVQAPDGGEVGIAFVVLRDAATVTEAELIAFAGARLASHQRPASILFTDRLPRNSVGKLVRDELRARGQDPTTGASLRRS